MNNNTEEIIGVGKRCLEDVIELRNDCRFTVDPMNSSNRTMCMSIPVRCFPESSSVVFVIPMFLNFDILNGKLQLCFDKSSINLYHTDLVSCPLNLVSDIFNNQKYDGNKFECNIEEIEITKENIKSINCFSDVKMNFNMVTIGNKPKYSENNLATPMFIERQLTFPNGGKDSKLFYVINDTFALGTKSKWLTSNSQDEFRGSMHVYLTCVTPREISDPEYMRKNYIYLQIKKKSTTSVGELITCTSKLYLISGKEN